ncbi:polysaccharide deacetylase [Clostridiaceae bacterium]|nr:polysaccharide deacetylase [Clostridiaceae bacterium]RKI17541.1 polysaccharide deacetylase [bacterium 1XD21-70]
MGDSPGTAIAEGQVARAEGGQADSQASGAEGGQPDSQAAVAEGGQADSQTAVAGGSQPPAEVAGDGQGASVITVGGTGQQNAGPAAAQEEAEKAAQEAARQAEEAAAQEAARQAEEAAAQEAARQAEEAAAQEAARQAEEAARQAAAQQALGRTVDPSKPMVALTYDDGPQPSVGNRIMDCLAQYGGKATFFMVGERVGSYATEVKRMVAEGHEVANHSMNHKYLQKQGVAEIQAQVSRCNDAIEAVCGVRPRVMRLPGGGYNSTVLANTHMPMIQWNIDTLDWKTRNAQQTVNSVLGKVKDGDIILMHELYGATGDASMTIIPELTKRGFQLVTISEMAAAKGYSLEAGKLYSSFR